MKQSGCCSKFGSSIVEEFQWEKIFLTHFPVDVFFTSQWQRGLKSFWWLLYRWCAAGFFIVAVFSTAVENFYNGAFFIYLSDWGLILCMITTTYGAVLATMWYFNFIKKANPVEQNNGIKLFWALHWSTLVLALVITLMYWAFMFPSDPAMGGNPYNIMQHVFNAIIMLIDHMVVAFPSRLLHFVYPLGIGIVYTLFSLIYFFCGGKDAEGNTFMYASLDWEYKPGMAVLTSLGGLFLSFIFSFLMFWLYKLRRFLYKECFNTHNPHVIPN